MPRRFADRLGFHVSRRSHQFALGVFDDIMHIALLMGAAHLLDRRRCAASLPMVQTTPGP
jgi:hypothetical protein